MPRLGYARPPSVMVRTPFGEFALDLGDARTLRAVAGGDSEVPPLVKDGRPFAIRMSFVHSADTGRFSLLADGTMVAKGHGDPAGTTCPEGWMDVALAVDHAVIRLTEDHPELSTMAEVGDLETQVATAYAQLAGPSRIHGIASDLATKRRSLLGLVA